MKQLGSVEWANEFFQDAAGTSQVNQQKDLIDTVDDNKSQYSKVRVGLRSIAFCMHYSVFVVYEIHEGGWRWGN